MRIQRTRLSFRQDERGGPIRQKPAEAQVSEFARQTRPVLLIHGYNNDKKEAYEAYSAFQNMQRQLGDIDFDRPAANGRLVEIYWPGDADWGIVSFLYYMRSIEKAKETADYLAKTIKQAVDEGGFKLIDVVAHSVGCRLTVELLKRLRGVPNLVIRRIVFMAAAIPTFMLEPQPDAKGLRKAYDEVLQEGAQSLYSRADKVVAFAFPLGQTLAPGSEGAFPTALGHDFWGGSIPSNLTQIRIPGARHSDYWPGKKKKKRKEKHARAVRMANRKVREFLELGPIVARELPNREIDDRETEEESPLDIEREITDRNPDDWMDSVWDLN